MKRLSTEPPAELRRDVNAALTNIKAAMAPHGEFQILVFAVEKKGAHIAVSTAGLSDMFDAFLVFMTIQLEKLEAKERGDEAIIH